MPIATIRAGVDTVSAHSLTRTLLDGATLYGFAALNSGSYKPAIYGYSTGLSEAVDVDYPAETDVRSGVTYGETGYTGTLALPLVADVRLGTQYGAGGTEYTGTLASDAPVMTLSSEAASAHINAQAALLNNGYLRIYSGSMPATADAPVGAATLLAELRFANPAFHAAIDGVATSYPIIGDLQADANGTAAWFRAYKADSTAPVCQGTVGLADAAIIMNTTDIVAGQAVNMTVFALAQSKG